jgi:toxin ParE1/3/4
MASIGWTTEAIENLEAIRAYIEYFNSEAAERIVERLVAAANSLSSFPGRGRPADDDLRELSIIPPYIIRYRVEGDMVVITRIRHGRQRH